MRYGLTQTQLFVFKYIEYFIEINSYSPTQTEIAQALHTRNKNSKTKSKNVQGILESLRERGWIAWIPNCEASFTIMPDWQNTYFPNQYNPNKVKDHANNMRDGE